MITNHSGQSKNKKNIQEGRLWRELVKEKAAKKQTEAN
jgi:hypothetical protein